MVQHLPLRHIRLFPSKRIASFSSSRRNSSQISTCHRRPNTSSCLSAIRLDNQNGFIHDRQRFRLNCRKVSTLENNTSSNLLKDQTSHLLPPGITRQPDFFQEGITFIQNLDPVHITNETPLNPNTNPFNNEEYDITEATSAFDNMCLSIISRGCASIHEGNDGEGPEVRAWHAAAVGWAELLEHASRWNCGDGSKVVTAAPMLAVAAVSPVLAQGGLGYLRRIDGLLDDSSSDFGSLVEMARFAVGFRDVFVASGGERSDASVSIVSPRERWHLHALNQLLRDNHRGAMGAYLRLLEFFPGDLLGLSLALDVAYTLGDADLALRASTSVSSYWTERDVGRFRGNHSHPGQTIATSLLAVGLSSSKTTAAERLAEVALSRDEDSAGGNAVWALAHSLAGEGRSQEMVSKLSTSDGVRLYETAGYLGFNMRMSGYGALSILDTQRSGADRSAIRLYDGSFAHVLRYSGNNVEGMDIGGEEVALKKLDVPTSVKNNIKGAMGSMFSGWFGGKQSESDSVATPQPDQTPMQGTEAYKRSAEAVLTWLPPSPILITHATALLLRLTLSDAIPASDERWADVKTAWSLMLRHDNSSEQSSIEFMPLALLAASSLFEPKQLHVKPVPPQLENAMEGLHKMSNLMKLGQPKVQMTTSKSNNTQAEEWRTVLNCLSRAIESSRWELPQGISSPTYIPAPNLHNSASRSHIGWDFDIRQFIEYAICHAAMKAGDYESLCVAKALCSEGVTLRSNCPEMWHRYALILDQLGDEVAAENARAASVSLGGGEGSSF